jgi:hypothetical protein
MIRKNLISRREKANNSFWGRSFPKNVCLLAMDLGNMLKEDPVKRKDRVSCEVNRIRATGVGPPLLARTNICVGARTDQSA